MWSAMLGLYTPQGGIGITKASEGEAEKKTFLVAEHQLAEPLGIEYRAAVVNVMAEGAHIMEHTDQKKEKLRCLKERKCGSSSLHSVSME